MDNLPTIRELVAYTQLTQAKFGERYGIPQRTIEHWCMGRRQPPPYVIYLLTLATGYTEEKHPD